MSHLVLYLILDICFKFHNSISSIFSYCRSVIYSCRKKNPPKSTEHSSVEQNMHQQCCYTQHMKTGHTTAWKHSQATCMFADKLQYSNI